jgi:hypothetical protein
MKSIIIIALLFTVNLLASAQSQIVTAANDFISLLDDDAKKKLQFEFTDAERYNWKFVPTSRKGISLHNLDSKQKAAGFALLKLSLASQGYKKSSDIIALEGILLEVEGREKDDTYRDPLNYYFSIFGTPSDKGLWGWRFEGHHLALNFSSADGKIKSSTPTFMGANPATVPSGDQKGKQTLKQETELGFKLVNSLSADQLKAARFSTTALPEIVSGNSRKAELLEPKGISYKELTPAQKTIFDELLNVYVKNYELGFSKTLMEKIQKAGVENLSFAWAGSLQPGEGHYYRIQGPMLLIEYDNTQTNANHVHTAVRDLTNDFAEDILKEHYSKEHK